MFQLKMLGSVYIVDNAPLDAEFSERPCHSENPHDWRPELRVIACVISGPIEQERRNNGSRNNRSRNNGVRCTCQGSGELHQAATRELFLPSPQFRNGAK